MYRLSEILASEIKRSNGKMKIEPVPASMQPSAKTLRRVKREIDSQLARNDLMREKSNNQ